MLKNKIVQLDVIPLNGYGASKPHFGTKKELAAMVSLCPRSIDALMRNGMPHLRIGARRCRFDLAECAAWLKNHYGCRRHGSAKVTVNALSAKAAK